MLRRLLIPLAAVAALFVFAVPAAAQTGPGYGGGATVTGSDTTVTPGEPITLNGTGFGPNDTVTLTFNSTPVALGTVQADANGAFTAQVTVPDVPPGPHTITAVGSPSGVTATFAVTVLGAGAAPPATPTPSTGGLAFTGTDVALTAGLGALLLVVGGLAVLATRKRHASS